MPKNTHTHTHTPTPRNLRVVDPNLPPRRPANASPDQPRDIRRTREYRAAARRWTGAIVAMPIALYTSYVLYDRTYGNKKTVHEKKGAGAGQEDG